LQNLCYFCINNTSSCFVHWHFSCTIFVSCIILSWLLDFSSKTISCPSRTPDQAISIIITAILGTTFTVYLMALYTLNYSYFQAKNTCSFEIIQAPWQRISSLPNSAYCMLARECTYWVCVHGAYVPFKG